MQEHLALKVSLCIRLLSAWMFSAQLLSLKTSDPATNTSTPAAVNASMDSRFTPPFTWSRGRLPYVHFHRQRLFRWSVAEVLLDGQLYR